MPSCGLGRPAGEFKVLDGEAAGIVRDQSQPHPVVPDSISGW